MPRRRPEVGAVPLPLLSEPGARSRGLTHRGEAVVRGGSRLYAIVERPDEATVRTCFAPFGRVGSLERVPASEGEEVVARGAG